MIFVAHVQRKNLCRPLQAERGGGWIVKSGPVIARRLRRRQARPGDIWLLDEVIVEERGRPFWLWRTVVQYGLVLELILQCKRDRRAAMRY